jgi:tRNA(Arg) A34 adenosine deaminase TadA
MKPKDQALLQQAVEIARRARQNGNHPFGALLAGPDGQVLLTAENSVVTGKDCTGHAETNLMRLASHQFEPEFLALCSLYTSTEPCAMC